MKKKILLAICCLVFILGGCHISDDNERSSQNLKDIAKTYVNDYQINEENDGSYTITILAPDFANIYADNINEDGEQEITQYDLENSEYDMKEYVFSCKSTDETEIEEAFLNNIAEELISRAISDIRITNEWGTDE